MPRKPLPLALAAAALALSLYVVAAPFLAAEYPPITDLPFHAASASILRHYLDPSFRFQEQFSLHFLESPYWSLYGLGAFFALFLPITWATKLASIVLLLLLPAGLSVLAVGMKKSPLMGLLALPLVWNTLTHWGFVNFMAAIGLFAMAVGNTLLLLERPSSSRQLTLALVLVAIFSTHIFRFPFALAAVLGTAVLMYPTTRRFSPIVVPMLPSLSLMGTWLLVRPKELSTAGMEHLQLHWERLKEIQGLLFGALTGPEEQRLFQQSFRIVIGVALAAAFLKLAEQQNPIEAVSSRALRFSVSAHLAVLCMAAVFLGLFLVLPMQIGIWWYVYPREIVSTAFMLLALVPNLPRALWARLPLLGFIAYGSIAQAALVRQNFEKIDATAADFRRITKHIPQAPKLGYIVWDRDHPSFNTHPFLHLPAWIQAEKGGWLSFHFVSWNASPIRYRENSPSVPPPTPSRFEWTPERFDLKTRGAFFDWFLVRRAQGPDPRFGSDPTLILVDRAGPYWLYRRQGVTLPPAE